MDSKLEFVRESMVTRRSAIKSLAALGALGVLGSNGHAATQPREWKTAIGLNGFASSSQKYNKTFPIWEVLGFAKREGFDGVELVDQWPMGGYPAATQHDRIADLRRQYDGFGLSLFSLQMGAGGAFSSDRAVRVGWVRHFRDRARLAQSLGCVHVGMWPGGPLRGQSINEAITNLASSFREAGKIAADLGLVAAFEIEPPFVFNTENHLQQILEQCDHSHLKTIYDPSHFDLMSGSTGRPHEMLARIGVDRIGYVHLTDTDGTLRDGGTSKHLPCGDGHVDIGASLHALRKGQFQGWLMIDGWEIPDPYDACRKGLAAIRRA